MSSIILVAETGSDITPELASQYNIQMVPMHVTFDNVTKDDGSFSPQEIVDFYKNTGKLPKTSGSMPEDFMKVFDEIHEKWPEAKILYLAYSAVTTCSYQSAVIASEERDYVYMVDTQHVSIGQGMVVVEVAKYLQENPDIAIEDAVEKAKEISKSARMCFTPENLEFLRAGGRVSNVAFLGARILSLHPCIELLDGKLVATKKFRGKMTKVATQLVKEYADVYKLKRDNLWFVYTVGLSDAVKNAVEEAAKECGFENMRWIQANGVITTHGGPEAFGLAGFTAE